MHLLIKSKCNGILALFQIHPACAMCSSSFGILDDQLLFACPDVKCDEQYCKNCVTAIQGSPAKHPFTCISCKTDIQPRQNILLEKHLIWPNMSKLYGTRKLIELQSRQKSLSCQSVLDDVEFRRIHLQSRLSTFVNQTERPAASSSSLDMSFVKQVKDLCSKLEGLTVELKKIDQSMKSRGVFVTRILRDYQTTMKDFNQLIDSLNSARSNQSSQRPESAEVYAMDRLARLPSEQNIPSIDTILEDVEFSQVYLSNCLKAVPIPSNEQTSYRDQELKKRLEKAKKRLTQMDTIAGDLAFLRANLHSIERWIEQYVDLLNDERQPDIPGSKFIYFLELLRTETEKLEVASNFPQTIDLMNRWWNELGIEQEFQPKILDLCRALEKDIHNAFEDRKSVYSIPYKIGVVGNTSVGKSALIMGLSDFKEFTSMVSLERSTFGYLQFDAFFQQGSKEIPVSFIDIAGAIDHDSSRSVGNYQELITQSDCDLYLIVFDNAFNRSNQAHLDYIEKILERQCLLVRTKVDLVFEEFYKAANGTKFRKDAATAYNIHAALEKTREYSIKTYEEKQLMDEVFLTAAGEQNELKDERFGQFDLGKLRKRIGNLAAKDLRIVRIRRLAIQAAKLAINTCFRRGYVASKSKYRWLAAGASVVPFLDELPKFFGEEQIRQSFGVHDRSQILNTFQRSKDSFEEYLTQLQCSIPKDLLKSGCFEYLIANETQTTTTTTTDFARIHLAQMKSTDSKAQQTSSGLPKTGILGTTCTAMGAIGQIFKDGIRMALPAAAGTLRVVTVLGIVLGAALTPVSAAWSYYSSGTRINEHLHLLCDDLQTILTFLIIQLCQQYQTTTMSLSFDDNNSSTDHTDDED